MEQAEWVLLPQAAEQVCREIMNHSSEDAK